MHNLEIITTHLLPSLKIYSDDTVQASLKLLKKILIQNYRFMFASTEVLTLLYSLDLEKVYILCVFASLHPTT